jgi:hypothetical protein
MTSGIIALIVGFAAGTGFASGFPAADAERRSGGGMLGFELLADKSRGATARPARRGNCDRGHRQFALDEE